jgi:hypothetical protein
MSGHQLINLEKYFYDMVTVLSRKNILGSMKKIYIGLIDLKVMNTSLLAKWLVQLNDASLAGK